MRPDLILYSVNNIAVGQRPDDGYLNATAMCQAAGKRMGNYLQNQETHAFVAELSGSTGIPADLLVQAITTGPNERRGTWVHPQVAIHLAMQKSDLRGKRYALEKTSGHGESVPQHEGQTTAERLAEGERVNGPEPHSILVVPLVEVSANRLYGFERFMALGHI